MHFTILLWVPGVTRRRAFLLNNSGRIVITSLEPAFRAKAVILAHLKRIFGRCGQTLDEQLLFVGEFLPAFYFYRAAFRAGFFAVLNHLL